jgi:hypothetical protein
MEDVVQLVAIGMTVLRDISRCRRRLPKAGFSEIYSLERRKTPGVSGKLESGLIFRDSRESTLERLETKNTAIYCMYL